MQTIQVVIDEKLLKATDVAARRRKLNRSLLIRNAIREHLKRLHNLELEQQERHAYKARPQQPEEYLPWLEIAAWPES